MKNKWIGKEGEFTVANGLPLASMLAKEGKDSKITQIGKDQ